ncbi:MAG TPA: sugar ABC transporter permease, partial [Clostridia bacterium]|nr:sugar ABC transporter permease [Clostridia bacterium]
MANIPAVKGGTPLNRRKKISDLRYDLKHNKPLLFMVFPSILYLFVLSYLPMVGIYYAFTNYNYQGGLFGSPFVGLGNFRFLFASGTAWKLTFNTVFYNLIFIFVGTALRITIAIMLSEIIGNMFRKVTQTIIFLPHFVSMVLVGVFAYNLMNYETGLINNIITSLGGDRFDFYGTPWIWR